MGYLNHLSDDDDDREFTKLLFSHRDQSHESELEDDTKATEERDFISHLFRSAE